MFTPSLGLTIALVFTLAYFLKSNDGEEGFLNELKKSPALFGIVFLISALFAVKSYSRNEDWKTDFKLFSRDIKYFPNSTHLLFYMGNHLSGNERKEVLNYEMTEQNFSYQQIMDSSAKENFNSIYYFTKSLSIFPALPSDGYNQLGKAYYNSGQIDSAEKYYNMAFVRDTTNGIFINNLGTVYYTLAARLVPVINAYGEAGKLDSVNFFMQQRVNNVLKSRMYFQKAHVKDPTESDFTNNIACSYGDLGIADSAIFWFEKSVSLDPLDTTAEKFLEITYRNLKNDAKANEWHKKFLDAKTVHLQRLAE
jgi:tetratricopeptide (TPR) repeat protein